MPVVAAVSACSASHRRLPRLPRCPGQCARYRRLSGAQPVRTLPLITARGVQDTCAGQDRAARRGGRGRPAGSGYTGTRLREIVPYPSRRRPQLAQRGGHLHPAGGRELTPDPRQLLLPPGRHLADQAAAGNVSGSSVARRCGDPARPAPDDVTGGDQPVSEPGHRRCLQVRARATCTTGPAEVGQHREHPELRQGHLRRPRTSRLRSATPASTHVAHLQDLSPVWSGPSFRQDPLRGEITP